MDESSLNSPPVFRRLLAGGTDELRLSLSSVAVLIGCGTIVLFVEMATAYVNGGGWATRSSSVAICVFTALMISLMAARWLGDRFGTLAGLLHMTGMHALMAGLSPKYTLSGATVTVAMVVFAMANVHGRLPLDSQKWTGWVFYVALGVSFVSSGPIGVASILTGCLIFILVNQDAKSLGFFANIWGILTLALLIGVWWIAGRPPFPATWDGDWTTIICRQGGLFSSAPTALMVACEMPVLLLPWTPFAIGAVCVGVVRGHYATPYWRFLGCWILGAYAAGILIGRPLTTAILPPMAVIGATGVSQYLKWSRRHSYRIPHPNCRVTS